MLILLLLKLYHYLSNINFQLSTSTNLIKLDSKWQNLHVNSIYNKVFSLLKATHDFILFSQIKKGGLDNTNLTSPCKTETDTRQITLQVSAFLLKTEITQKKTNNSLFHLSSFLFL